MIPGGARGGVREAAALCEWGAHLRAREVPMRRDEVLLAETVVDVVFIAR